MTYVAGSLVVTNPTAATVTVESIHWQTVKRGRKKSIEVLEIVVSGALNAGDAQDLAAYTLDVARKVKKHGVAYTKPVPLVSAAYAATTNTVILTPRGKLPKQTMQLTINAEAVRDASGRPLDGNRDRQPGGNFVAILNGGGVISMARARPSAERSRVSAQAFDALAETGHLRLARRLGYRHWRGRHGNATPS
jgi:hypothetical protein